MHSGVRPRKIMSENGNVFVEAIEHLMASRENLCLHDALLIGTKMLSVDFQVRFKFKL